MLRDTLAGIGKRLCKDRRDRGASFIVMMNRPWVVTSLARGQEGFRLGTYDRVYRRDRGLKIGLLRPHNGFANPEVSTGRWSRGRLTVADRERGFEYGYDSQGSRNAGYA